MKDYFKKDYEKGLWSMESITLIYMLFTTLLIAYYYEMKKFDQLEKSS